MRYSNPFFNVWLRAYQIRASVSLGQLKGAQSTPNFASTVVRCCCRASATPSIPQVLERKAPTRGCGYVHKYLIGSVTLLRAVVTHVSLYQARVASGLRSSSVLESSGSRVKEGDGSLSL